MADWGTTTELLVIGLEGRVERRDGHAVAAWPALPDYFGGNKLVFERPPARGDFERWMALFERALPGARHRAFCWGDEPGRIEPFLEAGFELSRCVVLTTERPVAPPRAHAGVDVRPLASDAEWADAAAKTGSGRVSQDFIWRHMARYRALVDAGHGLWFGAFLGGRRVAGLGVFAAGGLARYQEVVTHPDFRRQGIAGRLVAEAGRQAQRRLDARRLVIVAEEGSSAERIYRAAGFAPAGRLFELVRRPG